MRAREGRRKDRGGGLGAPQHKWHLGALPPLPTLGLGSGSHLAPHPRALAPCSCRVGPQSPSGALSSALRCPGLSPPCPCLPGWGARLWALTVSGRGAHRTFARPAAGEEPPPAAAPQATYSCRAGRTAPSWGLTSGQCSGLLLGKGSRVGAGWGRGRLGPTPAGPLGSLGPGPWGREPRAAESRPRKLRHLGAGAGREREGGRLPPWLGCRSPQHPVGGAVWARESSLALTRGRWGHTQIHSLPGRVQGPWAASGHPGCPSPAWVPTRLPALPVPALRGLCVLMTVTQRLQCLGFCVSPGRMWLHAGLSVFAALAPAWCHT